ncbi:ABC transporter permease [Sphaerimonospora thailandensis]|uniref:ABC transporter permease n=1 Tax=Sphaerimonospora thailandensis TaxID=795644 RepID=A0A8J3W145_9ACTN|nr:ABC transporter permease [Sphaerimonospora thailandensis]GIH71825.1 ABC transporter permease [Sphaerimonospora thailandensis]
MIDALAAEWLKIRTVRSTLIVLVVLAVFVGLMALLAWYAAAAWDAMTPEQRSHMAVSDLPPLAEWVASLALAVLGVLTITGEYGTGMIRTTFAAMPTRGAVLTAKAGVVAAVAYVTGLAAVVATFSVTRLIMGGRPIPGQSPEPLSDRLPLFLAMAFSITMFALLGLFLGAITRSAAGSIAILVAVWHLVPIVVSHLPAPWDERIGSLMPAALAGQLAGVGNPDSVYGSLLPPLVALAVMAAYVAVPYGLAALRLNRGDA